MTELDLEIRLARGQKIQTIFPLPSMTSLRNSRQKSETLRFSTCYSNSWKITLSWITALPAHLSSMRRSFSAEVMNCDWSNHAEENPLFPRS